MDQFKKRGYPARLKYLLTTVVAFGFLSIASHAFAQSGPPQPPGPPPPPDELFKKINPFKKHKKDTTAKKQDTSKNSGTVNAQAQRTGPPSPPNPMDLFKKKKKDTTKTGN